MKTREHGKEEKETGLKGGEGEGGGNAVGC